MIITKINKNEVQEQFKTIFKNIQIKPSLLNIKLKYLKGRINSVRIWKINQKIKKNFKMKI